MRLGLAGTGHWAEEVHLPTFAAHDGVDLVGIWGRSRDRTRTLAQQFAVRPFDRFEDMLAAVDIVAIALAPQAQVPLALAAARDGRHLFLEKPLAPSVEEAAGIAAAVASAGVASMVFLTRRFVPTLEAALHALQGQTFSGCRVRMLSGALLPGSPYRESAWRNAEGAVLWDLGPHVLSILLPVLGPVRHVSAIRRDHVVHLATGHADGARAEIALSLHADAKDAVAECAFQGPGGEVRLPSFAFSAEACRAACGRALDALLHDIGSGARNHACDVRSAAGAIAVLAAAERSIATGAPVALA